MCSTALSYLYSLLIKRVKGTILFYYVLAGCPASLGPSHGGLKKLSIFSAVHKILTPKTSTPHRGLTFFWIFWAVHDTSRTFDFLTP